MNRKYFLLHIIWGVLITALAASCTRDPYSGDPLFERTYTTHFDIELPGVSDVTTYSMGRDEMYYIRLLDLLMFDPVTKEFIYMVSAQDVTPDYYGSEDGILHKKFQVDLIYQPELDDAIFVLIANGRHYLSGVRRGDLLKDVMASLVFDLPADRKWPANYPNSDPIPMASEPVLLTHNGADLSTERFVLTRALLGINIQQSNNYNRLLFSDVYLYNINSRGFIAPPIFWDENVTGDEDNIYPPGNIRYRGPVVYSPNEDQYGNVYFSNDIFLPEIRNGADEPDEDRFFLVLSGWWYEPGHPQELVDTEWGYQTNITTRSPHAVKVYYKLEMIKHSQGQSDFVWDIPMMRNKNYYIVLYNSNIPGYATLEEAVEGVVFNRPGNEGVFDVDVVVDENGDRFLSDGTNFLTIDEADQKHVVPLEGETITINSIQTNHPDGWRAKFPSEDFAQWLSIEGDAFAGPGEKKPLTIKVSPSDTVRYGSVYVYCGRLSFLVRIGQGADFPNTQINNSIEEITVPANFNDNGNGLFHINVNYPFPAQSVSHSDDWYTFNNVPRQHVSTVVPPLGRQLYPYNDYSCAANDRDGYHNWRVPTLEEVFAFTDFCYQQYLDLQENGDMYGHSWQYQNFAQQQYVASTTNVANELYAYQLQTTYSNSILNVTRNQTAIIKFYFNQQTGYRSYVRCVRTPDEPFFIKTGTEMVFDPDNTTLYIVAYAKDEHGGLKWTKGDANFDDVVASVSSPSTEAAEHGYTRYEYVLTTAATQGRKGTSLVLSTVDNLHSFTIDISLAMSYGFLFENSRTNLGYDILLADEDQYWGQDWYTYANVPQGHNSHSQPPLGLQVSDGPGFNNSAKYSCASLGSIDGGVWRLPTPVEWDAMDTYMREESPNMTDLWAFGIGVPNNQQNWYGNYTNYMTSGTYVEDLLYYPYVQCYMHHIYDGNTVWTYSKAQTDAMNLRARCIKGLSDFYTMNPHIEFEPGQTKYAGILSKEGLSQSYTKSPDFDRYLTMTFPSAADKTLPDGTQLYEIKFENNYGADLDQVKLWLDVNSTSASTFRINLTLNPSGMLIPASETTLGYDMVMAIKDHSYSSGAQSSWYHQANVPDGYNSVEVPPYGLQVYDQDGPLGEREYSCAALRWGGSSGWRLPTYDEMKQINIYLTSISDKTSGIIGYGFNSNYYLTSTTNLNQPNFAYAWVYQMYWQNSNNYTYNGKTSTGYPSRCVRSGTDIIDSPEPYKIKDGGLGKEHTFTFTTRSTMQAGVTSSDGNFSSMISGAQLSHKATDGSGTQKWELKFTVVPGPAGTPRSTNFQLNTTDSRSLTVEVDQTNGNLIPLGFVIEDSHDNYNYSENRYYTWYEVANVPDGQETMDVPPAGTQVSPAREGSCASRGTGWRLPTYDELYDILTYLQTSDPAAPEVIGVEPTGWYYFLTATPYNNGSTDYPERYQGLYYCYNSAYRQVQNFTKNTTNNQNNIVRCIKDN